MPERFDPNVSISAIITALDWGVFCVVGLLTVGAVVFGEWRRRKISDEVGERARFFDLLLMGRRLTLPLFVATLVATWYGGILGVTEISFRYGIFNFITQGVFWYGTYIIFALFIAPRIAAFEAVTLPDLVGKMFGPRSRRLSAVLNLLGVLPVAYAISLGLLLQMLFGGELWQAMALGVAIVLLYATWGGLRAVVWSDLMQFGVMCGGVLMVAWVSVTELGGMGFLRAHLPATHFSLTGGEHWLQVCVWGFIALATLVDPNFYQRCFAADSPRTIRLGILLSTCVWFVFDICTTLGGMYARAVLPDAEPGRAYLLYAVQLLPDGARGLLLAGVTATILSTLDSFVFLAGTTIAYDLMPSRWRGRVILHRLGMVAAGAMAVGIGVLFEGNIMEVWKTLGSYATACLLLPMLGGYLWPGRIRDNQFLCASLFGMAATTLWRLWQPSASWGQNIDPLYAGCFSSLFGLLLYGIAGKGYGFLRGERKGGQWAKHPQR